MPQFQAGTEEHAAALLTPPAPLEQAKPLPFNWWRLREAARLEERATRLYAVSNWMEETSRKLGRAMAYGCGGALAGGLVATLQGSVILSLMEGFPVSLVLRLSLTLGATVACAGAPAYLFFWVLADCFKNSADPLHRKALALKEEHAALHPLKPGELPS